jgi:hypothetical protein
MDGKPTEFKCKRCGKFLVEFLDYAGQLSIACPDDDCERARTAGYSEAAERDAQAAIENERENFDDPTYRVDSQRADEDKE